MDQFKDHETQKPPAPAAQPPKPPKPRKWVAPAIFAAAVLIPVVILILSNTDSTRLEFAGLEWSAPLWLILAATFAAGAVVTRLAGWVWRAMRKRRKAQGSS